MTKDTTKTLLLERKALFQDAVRQRKPSRVPTMDTSTSWKIYHTNLEPKPSITEATVDHNIMDNVLREHLTTYRFDGVSGASITNGRIAAVVGMDRMITQVYDDDRMIQALSVNFMKNEELSEYAEDQTMYIWTKVMERRFGKLTIGQLRELTKIMLDDGVRRKQTATMMTEELGIPNLTGSGWFMSATEFLFQSYMGIRGFSGAMRRVPEALEQITQKLDNEALSMLDGMLTASGEYDAFDVSTTLLSHSSMSAKQFERFYWPALKKAIDKVVAADKTMYIFVEADILRFSDFMKDIPQGHVAVSVEQDDIFDVRKKLPNLCLIGGMPTEALGKGSKEKCLGIAQKLCDELGETGYIFAPDKLLAYPGDARPENLKAVQDYVVEHRLA